MRALGRAGAGAPWLPAQTGNLCDGVVTGNLWGAAVAGASAAVIDMGELKQTRTVVITNPQGLHARPADLFARTANRFESKIEVVRDNIRVNGKSILDIMTLAAAEGTELVLEACGPDAEEALEALATLVALDFEEEDATTD